MAKKTGKDTLASLKKQVSLQNNEIKQLKSKLSMSSSAFLNIVGKSLDGVLIIDQNKMVVYTNYAAIKLFNRSIADLLGEPLNLDFNPKHLIDSDDALSELHIPKADGGETIAEVYVLQTEWNNEPCFVVSFRDITERKKTEKMLQHVATHDFLTNLPNRACFEAEIDKAIQVAKENAQLMALVYLDLDNFKIINDTLGHSVGDELLQKVSSVLLKSGRRNDFVARLGGDEFGVVLFSLRKADDAARVSRFILDNLGPPFNLGGKEVYINASIGIAIYPNCGTTAAELIKHADTAMYVAKESGKNQYRFYSEDSSHENDKNLLIINGLRNAIRNKEFILEYQPIIDLNTFTCSGAEALIRWKHPQLGLIFPEQFLPYAEDIGAMVSIGRWVIQQALDDYSQLKLTSSFVIPINMSANEFIAIDVEEFILSCLSKRNIPAQKLVLELTETVIIRNLDTIINKFNRLADAGVKIAIDDYGMGYSSLSLLKELPISIVKIDKSFINDTVIVKSTIQLAHNLGLSVIAEGVETKEQLDFLKKNGCDYVQGYYFSKSLGIEALVEYLKNH